MATCYYITKEAFKRLNDEIEELEYNVLPVVLKEVSTARGNGDLSENSEYHAAKDKQRSTLRKIGYLKDFKANAQVVDCEVENKTCDVAKFGMYVEILNIDNDRKRVIRLVGDYEADVTKNLISVSAPLGRSLIGKRVDDCVDVETQDNIQSYKVIRISNKSI